ncbi:uncharacterized protein LOC110057762 [Orbicella faveolata]|uniref:uncharacterized protein LOC110057762 n=1 Tax=Orbicella faveolata TaxID=48498 RepID=UPI0009E216F9|nr:uncharacterized protein LOC110057762 [Orbicella faveolata]
MKKMYGKKHDSWIRKMVLNIAGFSSHTYHFRISEIILLIVAIVLEIGSSLCLNSVKTICAGQCLLFAKLFERARILQGSDTTWCFLPLFLNFIAVSSSLLLLRFISGGRTRSHFSCIQALSLVSLSAFLVFLASGIISSGFLTFCDSFVINRCNHGHFKAMDWRNFTPKYSDCGNAYLLLQSAQWCSWFAFALLFILCMIHATRLFFGLQGSSSS